jgi:hypothetical protein
MAITLEKQIEEIIVRPSGEVTVVECNRTIETTTRIRQVAAPIDPENPGAPPAMIDESYEEVKVLGNGYTRRGIKPGDNYLEEEPRVRDICALVHTETYLGYPVSNDDMSGKWEAFNDYILLEPNYNAYVDVVAQTSKFLPAYLADAYAMISKSGTNNFQRLYTMFCDLGAVTQEHKDLWGNKATEIGLPVDFCGILKSSV